MKRSKTLAISGILAVTTLLLTAVPASANTKSGGSVACGPDQTVQISWVQNKKGVVHTDYKATKNDGWDTNNWADGVKGANEFVMSGVRSIYAWRLRATATGLVISSASAGCVG